MRDHAGCDVPYCLSSTIARYTVWLNVPEEQEFLTGGIVFDEEGSAVVDGGGGGIAAVAERHSADGEVFRYGLILTVWDQPGMCMSIERREERCKE